MEAFGSRRFRPLFGSVLFKQEMISNLFWEVLEALSSSRVDPLGCCDHENELTGRIVKFYLTTRMHWTVGKACV